MNLVYGLEGRYKKAVVVSEEVHAFYYYSGTPARYCSAAADIVRGLSLFLSRVLNL